MMRRTEVIEMSQGEKLEMVVDIYESGDAVTSNDLSANTSQRKTLQNTGSSSVKKRSQKAAEMCLSLMCVHLLMAVIVLYVFFTIERQRWQINTSSLNQERLRLLNNNNNLTEERELMKVQFNQLDQLAVKYGLIIYKSSVYFISSEMKTWSESRQDCAEIGADLVVKKSSKELEFLQGLLNMETFWVGLHRTDGTWKWIDGSSADSGLVVYDSGKNNCSVMTSSGLTDWSHTVIARWVCKRDLASISFHQKQH
ncbi:hypothetical protein DNTS_015434 [Danionella cerebrum]|uniref:C-type lectin domain-containing protein n=1 Tax=Danionella cerebrum TaxID=2873325 RepID=A0A553NIN7_9TELE|nr:hypothetical protein DNTS_015434 [Danionella translucida]